jgi:DNA polymerase-3 subunit epsilon
MARIARPAYPSFSQPYGQSYGRLPSPQGAGLQPAQDRADAQAWAQRLLARGDWVVLDAETTGLDGAAEMVQLAVLAADGRPLLDTLLRPQAPISPGAAAIHGLTAARVARAPAYPEIHAGLARLIAGRTVIAYNAAFDRRIVEQTAARYGLPAPAARWECAMMQYARYVGERNLHRGGYKWQKLPALPGARMHSAAGDCQATLAVLLEMAGLAGLTVN